MKLLPLIALSAAAWCMLAVFHAQSQGQQAEKRQMPVQELSAILSSHAVAGHCFQVSMEITRPSSTPDAEQEVTHYCLVADPLSSRFRLDSLEMETKTDAFPFYTVTLSDGKTRVRWQRTCERPNRDRVMALMAAPSDKAHSALFDVLRPGVAYTRKAEKMDSSLGPFLRWCGFEYGPFRGPELCHWATAHGGKVVAENNTLTLSYDKGTTFTFDKSGGLQSAHTMADDGRLFEDLAVQKTASLGGTTLPSEVQLTHLAPDGHKEISKIKIIGSPRLLSDAQFTELLNPLFPEGLSVIPRLDSHYRLSAPSRSLDHVLP